METPDISKQKYFFPETDYTTVEFLALEILTSDNARRWVDDLGENYEGPLMRILKISEFL